MISMGVFIGQSTKIYDRATGEVHYGRVPSGSVVVPGSLPSADGKYSLACAVIVKRVDADTRAKTSINELLARPDARCRTPLDLAKQLIACRSITPGRRRAAST